MAVNAGVLEVAVVDYETDGSNTEDLTAADLGGIDDPMSVVAVNASGENVDWNDGTLTYTGTPGTITLRVEGRR